MTITAKQFNKLVTKDDLENLATKTEISAFKDEILTDSCLQHLVDITTFCSMRFKITNYS